MNFYSLPPLFCTTLFFTLGLFVFLSRRSSPVNLAYALWALTTVWWQASWTVLFNVSNPALASLIVRIGYTGIIFIPVAFYHFVIEFLGQRQRRPHVIAAYGVGIAFLTLLWTTNLFINGFYRFFWGFYPKAGILHPIYVAFLTGLALHGLFLLYKDSIGEGRKPFRHNQIQYVFWATAAYCLAGTDFLINYGVEFYPFGVLPLLISFGAIGLAIYRFRLMDLNLAFRYAAINLFFAILVGVPICGLVWYTQSLVFAVITIFAGALAAPFLFKKIEAKLTTAVDQLPPFRGKYRRVADLERYQGEIGKARSVDEWSWQVVTSVGNLFGASVVNILVHDPNLKSYHIKAGLGLNSAAMAFLQLKADSGLASYMQKEKGILIKEALEFTFGRKEAEQLAGDMDFLQAEISLPFLMRGKLIAVLNLGHKADRAMYNELDLSALWGLARAAEETLRSILSGLEQKQFTAEWAHDLAHPFGPKGSLKFIEQALDNAFGPVNDELKEALQLILRDSQFVSKRIGSLVQPLEAMSKEAYDIQPRSLAGVYARVRAKYMISAIEADVKLVIKPPPNELKVLCDDELLEYRVITNLIENAFRYTPKGGTIEVGYAIKEKSFVGYVKDSGIGMAKEVLESIFEKGTQGNEGPKGKAGLGLYNVATVLKAQEGKVWAESEPGKGATFFFEMPLQEKKP